MALAQDALSGPGGTGDNGHIFSGSAASSPITTSASFFSPSSSASLMIVGLAFSDALTNIGTMSMAWDPSATNQSMTSLGQVEETADTKSIFMFGLVSPGTTGAKAVKFSWTGSASGDVYEVYGISYTGSITTSVAAATQGFQTNTGSSGTASVTTAVSIPTGGLVTSWFVTDGSPFSAVSNTEIDIDATQIDVACSTATGAGSAITSTGTLSPTTTWAAMTVGILAQLPYYPYSPYQNQPDLSPILAQRHRDFSGWNSNSDHRWRRWRRQRGLIVPTKNIITLKKAA